jgi:peptidoglycan/LPS O-acetylase OafA/YrhL
VEPGTKWKSRLTNHDTGSDHPSARLVTANSVLGEPEKRAAEQPTFYFPELDGLRFIAFLLVFIHHAPATHQPIVSFIHAFGWIGVDLFFALSAFLFVKLLSREFHRTGTISAKKFYIRRGLRIWPLYFMFCIVMILPIDIFGPVAFLSSRAVGLFTFADNILTARSNYNPIHFTAHLWTISYEEQFYLVIPVLLLFLFRSSRSRVVTFLSASTFVLIVVRATLIHLLRTPHPAIWVLPVTHFESIVLGIVVGLGGFDVLFSRFPAILVLACGLFSGWLMTRLGPIEGIRWNLMISYPLIGLSTSLIVYFVFRTGQAPWMKWLSFGPFVYLGKISYGLYVYHLLGLFLGRQLVERQPFLQSGFFYSGYVATCLASLSITIAISSASYLLIEKPFLRLKKRFEVIASRPV